MLKSYLILKFFAYGLLFIFKQRVIWRIEWGIHLEFLDQQSDFATFWGLPQVSWYIEESGLKKENKADPLIVLVILHLFSLLKSKINVFLKTFQKKLF